MQGRYLSIHLSIYLFIHLFIYLYAHLLTYTFLTDLKVRHIRSASYCRR